MKTLLKILLYIWQLPQNLLGLILRMLYTTDNKIIYKDKTVRICKKFNGGISLGETIIVNKFPNNQPSWNTVKHEWGHTKQSLYFGPLYLIIIGIPSIVWALLYGTVIKNVSYSAFCIEDWADKLGNVKR